MGQLGSHDLPARSSGGMIEIIVRCLPRPPPIDHCWRHSCAGHRHFTHKLLSTGSCNVTN